MGCTASKPKASPTLHNRYSLGKAIFDNKFSVVLEGRLKSISRSKVAIKIYTNYRMDLADLATEIPKWQGMNLSSIFNVHSDRNFLYFVTELCTGGALFDRVLATERFDEVAAARIMWQIFEIVAVFHRSGTAHMTICADSFMYLKPSPTSPIKLVKFGFKQRLKKGSRVISSLPFRPADSEREKACYFSDLWNCGLILYTLLTGRYSLYEQNRKELLPLCMENMTFDDPVWEHISDEAKDLVRHLMQKDLSFNYSIEEALGHPWLTKPQGPALHIDQTIADAYTKLRTESRLEENAKNFLVNNFLWEEITSLRPIFSDLKEQKINIVNPVEVKKVLISKTPPSLIPELEAIFQPAEQVEGCAISPFTIINESQGCQFKVNKEKLSTIYAPHSFYTRGPVLRKILNQGLQALHKTLSEEDFQARLDELQMSPEHEISLEKFMEFLMPGVNAFENHYYSYMWRNT